ncbi:MAG: hypothetical protein CSA49_00320 [Gammaproteobacteria bacterium]|nr:MAG: hypothetical protein CSA49_00320 [Gammaproteobacteria bacterium]
MGLSITRATFSDSEYQTFSDKVRLNLRVFKELLKQPGFGDGPSSIGAEVEFYIVDQDLLAKPVNTDIAKKLSDPLLTVELNRFNLEYNLNPQPFSGAPFLATEHELHSAIHKINGAAKPMGGQLVPIGILPTLRHSDIGPEMMTDLPRYHALSNALCKMRGGPFQIRIDGSNALDFQTNDVTLEGANTSFQLHWRVPADRFADYFNAVQLVTPIVLALAANSPSLFGHHLWDETRIALFKQSIDSRSPSQKTWRQPPRVYFGNGWAKNAWELFASAAALYPPIIPVISHEDPVATFKQGKAPELAELKLHQGTTWPWNRAVYDHNDGGHLRIEVRSLPAGPTPVDMSANGLFIIGAALAVLEDIDHFTSILPFHYAEYNFYRAAKYGLNANLIWPNKTQVQLHDLPLMEIVSQLLPKIEDALGKTDIDSNEITRLLAIIKGRIDGNISGARWQRQMAEAYMKTHPVDEAFKLMLEQYMKNQSSNKPLHEWSITQ